MRTKKVTRYYCDHCGRGSLTKDSMERHECVCLRNPNRACFLCEDDVQPIDELKKTLIGCEGDLTMLREAAHNCPACILSAILQLVPKGKRDSDDTWFDFDYKKEKDAWLLKDRIELQGAIGPCEF